MKEAKTKAIRKKKAPISGKMHGPHMKPGSEQDIKHWISMREKKYPGQAAFD